MNEPSHSYIPNPKVVILTLILVVAAGLIGWKLGHTNNPSSNNGAGATTSSTSTNSVANADVNSLISYTLPDGWAQNTCSNAADRVFIIPNGASLNCNSNPSAPIKIYVDSQNTTDCQQLSGVQGVRKHVCISLYVDGHKSLKASTEYPKSSSYGTDTTISDYYINTGKGVVKIEYTYTSSNDYQTGFDQMALGVKVKA